MKDLIGKWKFFTAVSLLFIIVGLAFISTKGLNLGIDFTGGNLLEVKMAQDVSSGEVRETLGQFGLEKSPIQTAGDNTFIIRTRTLTEDENDGVINSLGTEFGQVDVLRNEKVDAIIGRELTMNGVLALVIASVLMVLYITYRFELNFAIAAIVALLHDVLVTLAFMGIFQLEVDSAFIAAVLTIVGYSINDTIVIFDRVRENLHSRRYKDLPNLVNDSIWQTMMRSINTLGTTIITLLALIFLGGETTKIFATAMLVGIISGTYSSFFVASPLWIFLREKRAPGKALRTQKV